MNGNMNQSGYRYRNRRNISRINKNSLWGTIITAIAGTVIRDLTSGNSKIKGFIANFTEARKLEQKKDSPKIIEAEYSVEEISTQTQKKEIGEKRK